jgi:hypothetical protein
MAAGFAIATVDYFTHSLNITTMIMMMMQEKNNTDTHCAESSPVIRVREIKIHLYLFLQKSNISRIATQHFC